MSFVICESREPPGAALTVDEIVYRLHGRSDVSNVAFLLLQMELAGWVEADGNRAYSRTVKEGNR